jgi:hypothetical protein
VRLFVADDGGVRELTRGPGPTDDAFVRVSAPDLQQARRARARIRSGADAPAVILDVTVAVAADFRSAQRALGSELTDSVHYAGTVDGLAGLISDIHTAGVADGVTLIPAAAQDLAEVGRTVLARLAGQPHRRAS